MSKVVILLIASAYLLYFFLTPPLTINDEPAHVRIIVGVAQGQYPFLGKSGYLDDSKELVANKKLKDALQYIDHAYQIPTFDTIGNLKEGVDDYNMKDIYSHQAYSPPFYYMVGAIFYYLSKITPYLLGQFYILRLTSAIFYIGTIFIFWKILSYFFNDKKSASSILIFFAINPLVLKMGIGINPDIGVTFFSLCFLYFLLKSFSDKLNLNATINIAILSGLAMLTKISGIFANLVFVIFTVVKYGIHKKTIRTLVIFEGVFLTIILPWFIFIFNRYHTLFPFPFAVCPKLEHNSVGTKIIETFTDFRFTIMQYSGFMGEGWPHPFKWFFVSYVILFVVFLVLGFIFALRQKKQIYKTAIIYILPLFLFLLTVNAQYKIKEFTCDIPGRYILPIFPVLSIFVFWGILVFIKDERKAAFLMKTFAIFHYLFILFTVLIIRYYV